MSHAGRKDWVQAQRAQTRASYNRLARWYDLFAGSEAVFTRAGLDLLNARPGERVLDVGPGTGGALIELAEQVTPSGLAVGIDLSEGMLRRAQVKARGRAAAPALVMGDAVFQPYACQSFEGVFISFTLELFAAEEIPLVLAEARRVLRRGGRLGVVSLWLPPHPNLTVRIYQWLHRRFPALIDCRPIRLNEILVESGFEISHSQSRSMWGLPVQITVARL